ncbi:MAG: hypothetical protein M0P57_10170 [Syntrophales bacterium]|nr:hypothetical protein [Syntrophales bacterium]
MHNDFFNMRRFGTSLFLLVSLALSVVCAPVDLQGVYAAERLRPPPKYLPSSSFEEFKRKIEAERRGSSGEPAREEMEAHEIRSNQRYLQKARDKLDQKFGSDWRGRAAQHADELPRVKRQLADRYNDGEKTWYDRLR